MLMAPQNFDDYWNLCQNINNTCSGCQGYIKVMIIKPKVAWALRFRDLNGMQKCVICDKCKNQVITLAIFP